MAAPREGTKKDHSFRNFKGVNTQADRKMIDNDEFAWLENVMPIGFGNARTLPAQSAALATLSANCYYMAEGNISGVSYMFMFCTDGSCYQINLITYAQTVVGAAGTFSGTTSKIAQWKNERIVIIDAVNGFFDWNGTALTSYNGTISSVSIIAGGINYTTSPTITPATGSAAFSATIGATLATIAGGGASYAVGDNLTAVGGTSTLAMTINVTSVSGGVITGINLTMPGIYTVAPANPVSVTGGHGSAATFTLNFGIIGVAVTNPGSGYSSAPVLNIAGGGGTGSNVVANMAVTAKGTSIATYAGRTWISSGRTILFSAPNTYNDFNPTNLAGSLVMTDDTLKGSIIRLFSANNFLYIIGQNSVNVISNVAVTSPVTTSTGVVVVAASTTFSNTNITPSIGTSMPDAVGAYYRSIMFSTDYGVVSLTGSTPQKISDELDGVFPLIDFTQAPSSGLATLYNILCLCYLVKYNDPTTGTARPILCIFFNKKWYFASQGNDLKFVASAYPEIDKPSLWGTDGIHLFKLFSDTTSNVSQIIKSRLWDMGSPLITKQVLKFGMETISSGAPASIATSLDTESNTTAYTSSSGNQLIWYNNTGAVINWLNNMSAPIIWYASGYVFTMQDVSAVGNYIGITETSSSPQLKYTGFHLQYEQRTPWITRPF